MIIDTLVAATLTCGTPQLINKTKTWTEADQMVYDIAKQKCSEIYKNDAPCLKKFVKVETNIYQVTCGK